MANTVSKDTYIDVFGTAPAFERPILNRIVSEDKGEEEEEEVAP